MATRNFPQQGVVITPQQDPITAGIAFNFDKSNTNGNLTIVDLPPTHGSSVLNQIPDGAITTKDGKMIVLTTGSNYILTVNGFVPLNALKTINGDVVKTKNFEFITTN